MGKVTDNHPAKGSKIKVEPIRNLEDLKKIKEILAGRPRDLCLFVLGINNGLRISDLLSLRVKDVARLKPGDCLEIKESKTGKANVLMVNKSSHKALKNYLDSSGAAGEDFLFRSNKTKKALTKHAVNHMIKKWCRLIGLQGNYGAHSLRKTFGYQQRTQFGVGFDILSKRFRHSCPSITMRYLGIEDKEVNQILLNEI
jgi:integrase